MPPTVPAKAPVVSVPAAPAHLSDAAKKQWSDVYTKALAQAKLDNPNNESAQRAAALKAANALLAVPAPTSAAEIDKLESWQVLLRETRATKDGQVRICVTADGRKYSFPVIAAQKQSNKPPSGDEKPPSGNEKPPSGDEKPPVA